MAHSPSLKTKTVHGVRTGNHSNPNVLKASRRYAGGGGIPAVRDAGGGDTDINPPKVRSESQAAQRGAKRPGKC